MSRLSESPAGQQILTLTQAEHIEAYPLAAFQSALDLIDAHRRLTSRRKGLATAPAPAALIR
jgi:hypothetical protein